VLNALSPSFLSVIVFSFLIDGYLVCINIDKDTNAMPTLSKYYNNNDNDNVDDNKMKQCTHKSLVPSGLLSKTH
jgi:hypothetical protein